MSKAEAFEVKFAGNKSINVEVDFRKGDEIKVPVNINSLDADVVANKIAEQLQLPEIDTSELAKENTLQELKKSVENVDIVISGGVAAELTAGKQAIAEALRNRGAEVTGNETLTELAQKIVESLALLPNGTTFSATPIDFGDVLNKSITEFVSLTNGFTTNLNLLANATAIILPNATTLPLNNSAGSKAAIKCLYLYMPKATRVNYSYYGPFQSNDGNSLRRVIVHPSSIDGSSGVAYFSIIGSKNTNLYSLEFSNVVYDSINIAPWNPTNAVSIYTNLIEPMKYDDPNEPTETFVTNKDKFLWYFRNHFLPKIGDCTTLGVNPTLTITSTVYNAIIGEADIVEYFASRNWNLASV